jgi:hypothetical protein
MKQSDASPIAALFQQLTSIYYLMVGLPLLAFSWVYLNLTLWEPWYFLDNSAVGTVGHIVLIGLAIGLGVMGVICYRRYLKQLEPLPPGTEATEALEWKVRVFCKVSLQQCMFLTASTLLVVLGFYVSLQQFYVPLYAVLLVFFSFNRPSPERIAEDMRMKKEERLALQEELRRRG